MTFAICAAVYLSLVSFLYVRFPALEHSFFESSDKECRDFASDAYDQAQLSGFRMPLSHRTPFPFFCFSSVSLFSLFLIPSDTPFAFSFIYTLALVVGQYLFAFDQAHYLLPDEAVFLFALLNTVLGAWSHMTLESTAYALIALCTLAFCLHIYFKWRKKDGMGLGDWKLLVAMTPWLGLSLFFLVLLPACFFALLFVLSLKIRGKDSSIIPFGPSLLLAWTLYPALYTPVVSSIF